MKIYNARICFGPDDVAIPSPVTLSDEDLADFVDVIGDTPAASNDTLLGDGTSSTTPGASEESTVPTETPTSGTPTGTEGTGEGAAEGTVEATPTIPTDAGTTGDAAPVTTPPTEAAPALSEIEVLKEQVDKLTRVISELSTGPKAVALPAKAEEAKAKTVKELVDSIDFDRVMDNKENFTAFLLEFAQTVKSESAQTTLQAIPNVVGSVVQRQATLNDIAREFYKVHPELLPVKPYVGRIANEISVANPELSISQVLEKAAEEAKKTLGLMKAAQTTEKKVAALPGAGGVRSASSKPVGLQKEIEDFLND
jgi:hypothetical protein